MRIKLNHFSLLVAMVFCVLSSNQLGAQSNAAARYETIPQTQDGIGKRYMGREIAGVMGWQGASWLERQEREKEERTDLLLADLNLKPGMVVADIGAGTGYLTRQMAKQVGATGSVFAVDVQPEMIEILQRLSKAAGVTNIKPVLGTASETKLPDQSIDLAIMVDVYHELEFPAEMLVSMIASLKPGGQLVFVEYRAEDPNVPIKAVHKMTEAQVKKEVAVFPALQWERTSKRLPWQHIVVFRKK
jgi:ubiquinone/menaquinone biosynthesis C-methylase UbiE